jgi:septum formation protein
MRLILASASARRFELLRAAGYDFDPVPVHVDETPRPHEGARAYVQRLASEKSRCAMEQLHGSSQDSIVLGADTAVVVDGDILGKPTSDGEAHRMIARLAGRTHEVLTGVSIRSGQEEVVHVESSTVTFTPMTPAEVSWYVSTGEGRDKAGAYAVQGLASRFVQRIDGSYSNVVGLPVAPVYAILDRYLSQKSL